MLLKGEPLVIKHGLLENPQFLYFPLLSNDFPRSSMMFNGISQRPAMLTPDTVSKMNHTAALTSVELRYILKILEIR